MEPAFTRVKPPKHPASIWWNLAALCLFFTVILGIFSSFYPAWSRIGKGELAAIQAAYPTSVGLATPQSRLFIGHWQNMLEVNDASNIYWIYDVDNFNVQSTAPDFGNRKCRGYLFASRILELIGWGLAFICLVLAILVVMLLGKWLTKGGWKPPVVPAFLAFVLAVLAFGCLLAAWLCWIVVAEVNCRPVGTPRSRIQGYSYSFVTAVFASGLALLAALFMCLGLLMMLKHKQPAYPDSKEMAYPEMFDAMPQYPAYPEYPVQEQMYVAPPVYMQQPTYPAVMEDSSYYAPAPVFSSPMGYPTVPY